MRSIVKSIHDHSLTAPDRTACIAKDGIVTYSELWNMITGISHRLKQMGTDAGDRIMLEAGHTIEYVSCCYGIQLSGAALVPFESGAPDRRIEEIAAEIQPSLIIKGKHLFEQMGVGSDELKSRAFDDCSFPREDMLQEILFTTGTTGKSKGVMVSHFTQMNMCESQNAVLDFSENNVWLIPTPMNHAAGLRKMHMSMVRGSTVLLIEGFRNLRLFFDSMKEYHVTSLYLPPSGVHYVLTLAAKELAKYDGQLDFLYSSSSALPGSDKEKLTEILPNVRKFDAYGGSEVGAVAYIDYNAVRGDGTCVGKPNPGVEIFTVDEFLRPCKATKDEPGIIAIRSNTVTPGYWNEPELTSETIIDGVIYMSDLGYIDEDGYLYLVGRRDDVINIGGLKVAPTEVEDVALRFGAINECACIPFDDEKLGRCVKMYVSLKPGCELDAQALTAFLEENLEGYKVPKYLEEISEIPKTFNGKINRRQLIKMSNDPAPEKLAGSVLHGQS